MTARAVKARTRKSFGDFVAGFFFWACCGQWPNKLLTETIGKVLRTRSGGWSFERGEEYQ